MVGPVAAECWMIRGGKKLYALASYLRGGCAQPAHQLRTGIIYKYYIVYI